MIRYQTYEGIGLLHGSYAKHRFVPHTHDEYSVAVITSGALSFDCGRQKHTAGPAMISAVNPGVVHTGQPGAESGWEYRHFFVPPAVLRQFVPELRSTPELVAPVIIDPELACLLVKAHAAASDDSSALAKDALLTEALAQLFCRHAAPERTLTPARADRRSTRLAQDYIRAHFNEKIRLKVIAEHVNLSPYHFLRTFARDTGLTPHAFQEQLRISYGLKRLREGAEPADAANDAGYADQSHFTRALKRTYGVTPSLIARAA